MSNVHILIKPYKNGYSVPVHEGYYALNIKYYAYRVSMPGEEYEKAYPMAAEAFFNRAEQICYAFGFQGFSVEGKSGGWLKPLLETNLAVRMAEDAYVSFEDHVLEEKIHRMFELIKEQFSNIKKILEYSESLEEFMGYIERYMSI